MKNFIFLFCLSFSFISLHSQVIYHDYGEEGLRIALNENVAWDVDEDGTVDLYVNQQIDELGFTPIFNFGCLASPHGAAYTPFQSRELQVFQEGDLAQLNDINLFDYIDTDRGSVYEDDNGVYALGWEDGVSLYIGFVLIQDFTAVKDGWMRIAVDEDSKELVIYELAHNEFAQLTSVSTGIIVGETGISSVNNYVENLSVVDLAPNPASDMINVSFEYSGTDKLALNVVDITGKEIYNYGNKALVGKHKIQIQTAAWNAGTYFLQMRSAKGVEVKKINIVK